MKRAILLFAACGLLCSGSALGGTLFAVDDASDALYTIDTTTGAATLRGSTGVDLSYSGLAFDYSDGTMYVSDVLEAPGAGLGTVGFGYGAVTYVGPHVSSNNIMGLAYVPNAGGLYGADIDNDGLVWLQREINPPAGGASPGEATFIGPWGTTTSIRGLAHDSKAGILYGIDETNLYTIDWNTGHATVVGAHGVDVGSAYMGLEYDQDTDVMYGAGAGDGNLYVIDTSTGAATLIGPTSLTAISGLASISNADGGGGGGGEPVCGYLFAVTDDTDEVWTLDPLTGEPTLCGPAMADLESSGLAFDSSTWTMYVTGVATVPWGYGLGKVDLDTGKVTLVSDEHVNFVDLAGLAYDSSTDTLWAADVDCYEDPSGPFGGLAWVDRATGQSTCIGVWNTAFAIRGLAYNPNTDILFGIDQTYVYTIDRDTGDAVLVGPHGAGVGDAYIGLEVVAATGIMYGIGLEYSSLYHINQRTGRASGVGYCGIGAVSGLAVVSQGPGLLIFADAFETGDISGWSLTDP